MRQTSTSKGGTTSVVKGCDTPKNGSQGWASPEMEKEKEKGTVNLGIPADVHARFAAWCEKRHHTKRDVAGTLVSWFMDQPEPVRSVVLGTLDEGLQAAYSDFLTKLAQGVMRAVPIVGSTGAFDMKLPGGQMVTVTPHAPASAPGEPNARAGPAEGTDPPSGKAARAPRARKRKTQRGHNSQRETAPAQ
jgi:hypothetical protein